jgi:hypothetical protein
VTEPPIEQPDTPLLDSARKEAAAHAIVEPEGQWQPAPPSMGEATANPYTLMQQALVSGAGVESLERLQAMQERYEDRLAQRELIQALANFKAECPTVVKTRENAGTRSSYASREDIERHIRPFMHKHGLVHTFGQVNGDNWVEVTCVLQHVGGGRMESGATRLPTEAVNRGMNKAQGVGNAIEYGRRYALCSVLGISTGDADTDGDTGDSHLPVDDEQLGRLTELANDMPPERYDQFLDFMGVGSLEAITRGDYRRAVNALESYHRERAKGGA